MDYGFTILYEESGCLVVSKPPGVLTQAPPGIDSMEVRIKAMLKARDNPPYAIYLGVPHRLDRPATGAMVFTTDAKATKRLGRQFERREVRKVYWAGVEGTVSPSEGTWADFLRKVPDEPRAEVVAEGHPEGRLAVLHYRTLAVRDGASWLEIELETGRTHQIRIQAASRGFPLLGDAQYGSQIAFGPQFEDARLQAIALHARTLEFKHPITKQPVSVVAPTSADWPAM